MNKTMRRAAHFAFATALTIALGSAVTVAADRANNKGVRRLAVTAEAVTDPKKVIYHVTGIRDSGTTSNTGVATSFHCRNLSAGPEILTFKVFTFDGDLVVNRAFTVDKGQTFTGSTHETALFAEDASLSPGKTIAQGAAVILSTNANMFCSAMIVDAAASEPRGMALHMVRFNPREGSVE